jgi:hypothetical protein
VNRTRSRTLREFSATSSTARRARHRGRRDHERAGEALARRRQDLRQRGLWLSQDHGRASVATQFSGDAGAYRAHRNRERVCKAGDEQQEEHEEALYKDRAAFLDDLRKTERATGIRLAASEQKAILSALGERDETAEICRDRDGKPETDAELRDTESVPLKESISDYFRREVLPHVPDAWIDESKTKVGYEVPLNRHFYVYEPPRPLEVIDAEIKQLEGEILAMLKEVTT